MRCPEFLSRYSEFHDRRLPASDADAFNEHAKTCPACRRYHRVLTRSTGVLRDLPPLEPEDRFRESLVHRIYVDQELEKVWIGGRGSAMTTGAVLALAIVLTALAWSPRLGPSPTEVVVSPPPLLDSAVRTTPVGSFSSSILVEAPAPDGGLWQSPHDLLYEYSSLHNRARRPAPVLVRTGAEPD